MKLVRIFIPLVFAFVLLSQPSCAGVDQDFVRFVKQRYPNCDIVKVEETQDYRVVALQCGVQLKTVKFRDVR